MKHQYSNTELRSRELYSYELSFLCSGLQGYWPRDQLRIIYSYLEDTGQEILRFHRLFLFLNKILRAL